MIWKKSILLSNEKVGEDALGNPIYKDKEVKSVDVRFTPWTDEQITLEGREVTRNEQRYLVPISYHDFPECQKVIMDGHTLDITQIIDLSPRYTIIQVKIYKE